MEKSEHETRMQEILEYLATLQIEEWMILRLASMIEKCFTNNSIKALKAFVANEWSPSDIFHWLTNNLSFHKINPYWSDSFDHIFFMESLLIKTGLSKKIAHSMVITQAWIFWISPVDLETAVKTFLKLGYDEEIIKHIANQMPHMFHMPATEIIDECKRASMAQRGLLWNTKLNTDYQLVKNPTPSFHTRETGGYRAYKILKTSVATKTTSVVEKKKTENAVDKTKVLAETRTETSRPKKTRFKPLKTFRPELTPEIIEKIKSSEIKAIIHLAETSRPKKARFKPLKTFRPELTPEIIEKIRRKKIKAIIYLDKETEFENESSVSEDLISTDESSLGVYKPNLEPLPQKPVKKRNSNARSIGKITVDDVAPTLDIKRMQALIESSAKEKEDKAWKKFLEQNGWLKDKASNQYQVCLILARWLPINVLVAPYHLEMKGAQSNKLCFWIKVLKSKKIQKLLLIPPETIEIRLFALRKIGRNFLKEPKWLLLPWETLSECELRYRINEIEARGKKAHLKPYIKMLLEPDRTRFLECVDSFIELIERRDTLLLHNLRNKNEEDEPIYDRLENIDIITPAELRIRLLAR